jgi:endonuclease/exonuclease/phosphatase family metal-dependent hydrolase
MRKLAAVVIAVLAALACDDSTTGPDTGTSFGTDRAGPGAIGVMTRNLYVGTDIERVMLVPPAEIPFAVAAVWAEIGQTNYPERVQALADEIAEHRPHVVGLQEVTTFYSQSPSDFIPFNAEHVELDFLELLSAALSQRGLDYDAVVQSTGFDVEIPMYVGPDPFDPASYDDIRMTDGEAILVRGDVAWDNAFWRNFQVYLPAPVGDAEIPLYRGFASVEITVKGRDFRFVSTHLQPAETGYGIQEAQALELLGLLGDSDAPVIVVGDFNSAADGSSTPTYEMIRGACFVDTWTVGSRRGPGYTCCQETMLQNPISVADRRLDIIFYRDRPTMSSGRFFGSVVAELLGGDPGDKTPSGLWPSDHLGVAAILRPAAGLALR